MTTTNAKAVETKNITVNATMKLVGTLFDYGGRNAEGNRFVTLVVSDAYETGKKAADGSPELAYEVILKASVLLWESTAKTLAWVPFQTKNGKTGFSARVSLYGTINIDRREPRPGERQQTRFWFNPRVAVPENREDGSRKWRELGEGEAGGAQMVFALVKRDQGEQPAAGARASAPKENAPAKKSAPVEVNAQPEPEVIIPGLTQDEPAPSAAAKIKAKVNARPKKLEADNLPY